MRATDPHGPRTADTTMTAGTPEPLENDLPLLTLVHQIVCRRVGAARHEYGGPLPGLRTPEFAAAPESVQVAALLAPAVAWILADPFRGPGRECP